MGRGLGVGGRHPINQRARIGSRRRQGIDCFIEFLPEWQRGNQFPSPRQRQLRRDLIGAIGKQRMQPDRRESASTKHSGRRSHRLFQQIENPRQRRRNPFRIPGKGRMPRAVAGNADAQPDFRRGWGEGVRHG